MKCPDCTPVRLCPEHWRPTLRRHRTREELETITAARIVALGRIRMVADAGYHKRAVSTAKRGA